MQSTQDENSGAFVAKRRFIAGAVCPRCAAMDKLVVDLETDTRSCVACGFSEARPPDPLAGKVVPELPTRVSRAAARRVETPAEAVRLLDPASTPAARSVHTDERID